MIYVRRRSETHPGVERSKANLRPHTLPITVSLIVPAIIGRPSVVINPMYGIISALQKYKSFTAKRQDSHQYDVQVVEQ